MSNNVGSKFTSSYALTSYDSATDALKKEITNNQGIDSVSKNELLAQLAQGKVDTANANTDNADTYANIVNSTQAKVKAAETLAAGNDPLYVTRRLVQDQQQALEDTPGRNQTILTGNNTPSSGAPTLLTTTPLGGTK